MAMRPPCAPLCREGGDRPEGEERPEGEDRTVGEGRPE